MLLGRCLAVGSAMKKGSQKGFCSEGGGFPKDGEYDPLGVCTTTVMQCLAATRSTSRRRAARESRMRKAMSFPRICHSQGDHLHKEGQCPGSF